MRTLLTFTIALFLDYLAYEDLKSYSVKGTTCTVLDVNFFFQENSNWCWVATYQMISHYHGLLEKDFSQIKYVKEVCGIDCCINEIDCSGEKQKCDIAKNPKFSPKKFRSERSPGDSALKWHELTAQIDKKLPMAFEFEPSGRANGHYFVIIGYCQEYRHLNGKMDSVLIVLDPLMSECEAETQMKYLPYSIYSGNSEQGYHGQTYYDIVPIKRESAIIQSNQFLDFDLITNDSIGFKLEKVKSYPKNNH